MAFVVSSLLVLSYEDFRELLDKMCRCDGMVDVADSKSAGGNSMWVRVPPPAPLEKTGIFHIGKAQSFSFLAAFNRASHSCTASLAARFALMVKLSCIALPVISFELDSRWA